MPWATLLCLVGSIYCSCIDDSPQCLCGTTVDKLIDFSVWEGGSMKVFKVMGPFSLKTIQNKIWVKLWQSKYLPCLHLSWIARMSVGLKKRSGGHAWRHSIYSPRDKQRLCPPFPPTLPGLSLCLLYAIDSFWKPTMEDLSSSSNGFGAPRVGETSLSNLT